MATKKLVAVSRIPMTQPARYAAAARLIRRAMDTLTVAAATAPPGTCNDLAALLEPHAEAMERGVDLPHDGTVSYPELPL